MPPEPVEYVVWHVPGWVWLPGELHDPIDHVRYTTEAGALDALEDIVRQAVAARADTLTHRSIGWFWDEDGRRVDRFDAFNRLRVTSLGYRVVGEPCVYRDGGAICVELERQFRWLRREKPRVTVEGRVYESPEAADVPVSDWLPPVPERVTLRMDVAEYWITLAGDLGEMTRRLGDED